MNRAPRLITVFFVLEILSACGPREVGPGVFKGTSPAPAEATVTRPPDAQPVVTAESESDGTVSLDDVPAPEEVEPAPTPSAATPTPSPSTSADRTNFIDRTLNRMRATLSGLFGVVLRRGHVYDQRRRQASLIMVGQEAARHERAGNPRATAPISPEKMHRALASESGVQSELITMLAEPDSASAGRVADTIAADFFRDPTLSAAKLSDLQTAIASFDANHLYGRDAAERVSDLTGKLDAQFARDAYASRGANFAKIVGASVVMAYTSELMIARAVKRADLARGVAPSAVGQALKGTWAHFSPLEFQGWHERFDQTLRAAGVEASALDRLQMRAFPKQGLGEITWLDSRAKDIRFAVVDHTTVERLGVDRAIVMHGNPEYFGENLYVVTQRLTEGDAELIASALTSRPESTTEAALSDIARAENKVDLAPTFADVKSLARRAPPLPQIEPARLATSAVILGTSGLLIDASARAQGRDAGVVAATYFLESRLPPERVLELHSPEVEQPVAVPFSRE